MSEREHYNGPFDFSNGTTDSPQREPLSAPVSSVVVWLAALLTMVGGVYSSYLVVRGKRPVINPQQGNFGNGLAPGFENAGGVGPGEFIQDPNIEREVLATLGRLGRAADKGEIDGVLAEFDLDAMCDAISSFAPMPISIHNRAMREGFKIGIRTRLRADLAQLREIPFEDLAIRSVRVVGFDDIVAYTRADLDGLFLKVRFWLKKSGGTWKIYDLEYADIGVRVSRSMGELIPDPAKPLPDLQKLRAQMAVFREACALMNRDDHERLRAFLPTMKVDALPNAFQAIKPFSEGAIAVMEEQWAVAERKFGEALAKNPQFAMCHLMQSIVANRRGRFTQARASAHRFLEIVGKDGHAYLQLAIAHDGDGNTGAAIRSAVDAMNDAPNLEEAAELFVKLHEDRDPKEIAEQFRKLTDPRKNFRAIAMALWKDDQFEALAEIVREHAEYDDASPVHKTFHAVVQNQNGEYEKALKLSAETLPKIKHLLTRRICLIAHLHAAYSLRRYVEGYQTAGAEEREFAFGYIARGLIAERTIAPLRNLTEVHAKEDPDSPVLLCAKAEIAFVDRRWDTAIELYRECRDAIDDEDPDVAKIVREHLVLALTRINKPLEAYREGDSTPETFEQIASDIDGDPQSQLLAVIEAHEKNAPGDILITYYRGRLALHADRFTGAMRAAEKCLDATDSKHIYHRRFERLYQDGSYHAERWQQAFQDAKTPISRLDDYCSRLLTHRRIAELSKALDAFEKSRPESHHLAYFRGRVYEEAKDNKAALQVYRKAYRASKVERHRLRWRIIELSDPKRNALSLFQELGRDESSFGALAWRLNKPELADELEKLINAYKKTEVREVNLARWQHRLAMHRKNYAEAKRIAKELLKRDGLPEWQRREFQGNIADAELAMNGPVAAYETASEKEQNGIFRRLAHTLRSRKDFQRLEELIAAHRKQQPDDKAILEFEGNMALDKKETHAAIKAFLTGFQNEKNERYTSFKYLLIDAHIRAGTPIAGYETLGKSKDDFFTIAARLAREKKWKLLRDLVAAHEKTHPKDAAILLWKAAEANATKNSKDVIRLVEPHQKAFRDHKHAGWYFGEWLKTAYLRLGQTDKATQFAARDYRDRFFELQIAAIKRDPKTARLRMYQWLWEEDADASAFYEDEFIAAALQTPGFADLARQFPKPKVEDK